MRIFQYGSNTLDSQLNGPDRLKGEAKFVGPAALSGWKISFAVESKGRGCAAATLVPSEGALCWGALYEIPEDFVYRERAKKLGQKSLDQIEGEGTNYHRENVKVRLPDESVEDAITYIGTNPKSGIETNLDYVTHVLKGLRSRGVPESYIVEVKEIAGENNPNLVQQIEKL